MKFDVILTNPPFQDSVKRNTTPHKLWIDFTLAVFDRFLNEGGSLLQVSPESFSSPSNVVLDLMAQNQTRVLRVGNAHHFPAVGSSFSDYWITKQPNDSSTTIVKRGAESFEIVLDRTIKYLPNDLCEYSMSIHSKVMFSDRKRLPVEWDYVTAHNIRRKEKNPTLATTESAEHRYPVFHTNRQVWWSSIRQPWADLKKVMWTRSGYTKPFYDPGRLGGTDMVYYVTVGNKKEGTSLAENLNSLLMQYILKTAKWSGFGNERVFAGLPDLPRDKSLSDEEMFSLFGLSEEEVRYVRKAMETSSRATRRA